MAKKKFKIVLLQKEVFGERECLNNDQIQTTKIIEQKILNEIFEMILKSYTLGITLRDFQDEIEQRLKSNNWFGVVQLTGPDGVRQPVNLSLPDRMATIYRTNLMVAYLSRRYKDMLANANNRPFWQYVTVLDARTRPFHRALHGKVFRYDDPFWTYFYPPNGWNCRCHVRAFNVKEVKERGLVIENSSSLIGPEGEWYKNYCSMDLLNKGCLFI